MRILFVTSEHPSFVSSEAGIFAREYVRELRKFADVVCVYFHLNKNSAPGPDENVDYVFSPRTVFEVFSADSRVLEQAASLRQAVDSLVVKFSPDIIHCNDAKSFLPFRFEKNVFFSSHFASASLNFFSGSGSGFCSAYCPDSDCGYFDFDDGKIERCALKFSPAVAVYSDFAADFAERVSGGLCSPIVLPCGVRAENFLESASEISDKTADTAEFKASAKSAAEIAERRIVPLRPPSFSFSADKSLFAAEKSLPFEIENHGTGKIFIEKSDVKFSECYEFVEKSDGKKSEKNFPERKIRVACFSRSPASSKNGSSAGGVNDFVFAVNRLGKSFKEKYGLEFLLFGFKDFIPGMDLSLFDCVPENFVCESYENCLKSADIVVIPSRYEPFGFVGLEAMARGALVLCPKGLGMDMFAEADFNCLEIPHNPEGIAEVLKNAVLNFEKYKIIRENAVRTSLEWTWERCVRSHLYVYRQIVKGRLSELSSAYRKEERNLIKKFRATSDVEKLYAAETERRLVFDSLSSVLSDSGLSGKSDFSLSGKKILVLTGVYLPEKSLFPENVEFFSVLNESDDGIPVRPECLPFDDKEFDFVFMCGSWEAVLEPCGALVEAQRVCRKRLAVFYFTGFPHSWQFFQIENDRDFEKLSGSGWKKLDLRENEKLNKEKTEENGLPYRKAVFARKSKESRNSGRSRVLAESAGAVYEKRRKILEGITA